MERERTNKVHVDEENQRMFIDAEPEDVAKAVFANAAPPDPSKRKKRSPLLDDNARRSSSNDDTGTNE